jgi:hypothetical protein
MDWKEAIREERAALQGIVALLFSLADLAELACGRSRVLCGFLFWLLHPAETAASAFIDLPRETARSGDVRADMMRLAASLRELASLVKAQADLIFSAPDGSGDPGDRHSSIAARAPRIVDALGPLAFAQPVSFPDTS